MIEVICSGDRAQSAQVQVISGRDLDSNLFRAWEDILEVTPELSSPFFSPTFTKIVSSVRDDVEIAVISVEGAAVAFFPFHRESTEATRAQPAADFMAEFDGLICKPGFICDPLDLIQECGLDQYDFRKCMGSQKFFEPFHGSCTPSAQIDLSDGYDAYATAKRAGGSKLFKRCANLARRMEREIGPLRFVAHSPDADLLHHVLALKTEQYLRTGVEDYMAYKWLRAVVERFHMTQTEAFAGTLSLLYAGDQLVAGHFGVRSRTTWHYWMPAYHVEVAKYSPGMNLLLRMAEYAPSIGLHTIDLGRVGRHPYKSRLMNRQFVTAEGSVERRAVAAEGRHDQRQFGDTGPAGEGPL
jgi:CelD/BcsL family acetyltransferase involved in cellulose biosynthesis